nr:MMPL family transporter [Treponema sp.]
IFTLVSSVIPVALIACGSAYGIHVLTHYYIALDEIEGEITKENHKEAILFALKDVWIAVFLSGLTTFIGFLSNVTSPIIPLKGFSFYTALGIVFALVLSVTFIPAMLMVKRLDKIGHKSRIMAKLEARVKSKIELARAHRHGETSKEGTSTYYVIYRFFTGTAPRLALTCLAIIIFSILGIKKIVVDTAMINYLPPDSDYRLDTDAIDERFAGTNQIFLLVKGQENGDMTKPSILKPIDDMQKELELHHPEIGKIVSFTTFLKRMNQVMHVPVIASDSSSESFEDDYVAEDSSDEGFSSFFDDENATDESSDEGFSSFFDDEENTSESSSDEGFSSFFDDENSSSENVATDEFVDPNIKYAEELSKPMSYADGIALLNSAYAEAGGSHAKVRDIVRILQKKMNYNGLDYYEVPSDVRKYPVTDEEGLANLVSQYLILLGNDDMNKFLQSDMIQPKDMRITVMLRTHNTVGTKAVIADAEDYAKKHFPEGYTLEATGNAQMEAAMADMVVSSQLVSLLLSLISVFLILAISFKSPFAGLIGCLPLAFSILLNYMVMGFANINLDLFTSIIASVAVGVGIDYTIHFMESYKAERQKSDDLRTVTIGTFRKSGSGIVTNAIAVGLGFLVLCLSYFVILRYIGLLIAVVMFTSSAMAMTIIPGVLNLTDPRFMRGKNKPQSMPAGAATASTIDVDSNKEKIEKLEKGNK